MAIPFTVDISAFYGEPDFREQNSSTIVDRRKTLNLHKELESGKTRDAVPQPRKREGGAIGFRPLRLTGSCAATPGVQTVGTLHVPAEQQPPAVPLLSMNNN